MVPVNTAVVPAKPPIYVCTTQAAATRLKELDETRETVVYATDQDTLVYLSQMTPCLIPDNTPESRQTMAQLATLLCNLGNEVFIHPLEGAAPGWSLEDALADGMTREEFAALPFQKRTNKVVDLKPKQVRQAKPASASDTAREKWRSLGLEFAHNGQPYENIDNALRALSASGTPIWHDNFLKHAVYAINCEPREFDKPDFTGLTVWFQRDLELRRMSTRTVTAAAEWYMAENARNCAQEWMHGLTWDQTPRLHQLAVDGFGCKDDDYHQATLRCFVMSMVARVLNPGCQCDFMPIFEGPQGARKSSALRLLAGQWFAEYHGDIRNVKAFQECLRGKMLVEFSELASLKSADRELLDGIVTDRVDTFRAAYGMASRDWPRMCVLSGTTNRDDWNRSDVGARRYPPIAVGIIDLEWIAANRLQLFAEAVHRIKAGEPYYDIPMDQLHALTEQRRADDPWQAAIELWLEGRKAVTVPDVMQHCLQIEIAKADNGAAARVRSCLRVAGWQGGHKVWLDGATRNAWVPPNYASERIAAIKADQAPKPVTPAPIAPQDINPPDALSDCPF